MPSPHDFEVFLREAVARLRDEVGAERVVLFGSRAQASPPSGSDVDLFVVLETREPPLLRRVRLRRLLASDRQRVPFDLVVLTPQELRERFAMQDRFVEGVMAHGRTLHGS